MNIDALRFRTFGLAALFAAGTLLAGTATAADTTAPKMSAPETQSVDAFCKAHKDRCSRYKVCVTQKMSVAETYCGSHPEACEAEKKGVYTQCHGEAMGKKFTG